MINKMFVFVLLYFGSCFFSIAEVEPATHQNFENVSKNVNYKNIESVDGESVIDFHTIKDVHFRWDPYRGDYIDEYIFLLEDDSIWIFNWSVYEFNQLCLQAGDEVAIIRLDNDQYLMSIPGKEGSEAKYITFTESDWQNGRYLAEYY